MEKSDTNNNDPAIARARLPRDTLSRSRSDRDAAGTSGTDTTPRDCDVTDTVATPGDGVGNSLAERDKGDDVSTSGAPPSGTKTNSGTGSPSSSSGLPWLPGNHAAVRKCYYCGKRFTKLGDFQQHLISHLGKKAFKCRDCGKRFRVKSNLLFHQQAAHGPTNQLPSLVSRDHVSSQSELSMHPGLTKPSSSEASSSNSVGRSHVMATTSSLETPGKMAADKMADSGGESSVKSSPTEGSTDPSPGNNNNKKLGTNGFSPHSSTGSGGSLERELAAAEDFIMEYPSQFPGLKHQISIKNETVLITRLDGTNLTTGEKTSLYKCHMCGKVFNFLSKLQCHLSLHFERHMTLYQCTYCDAHFKFKTLLLQHLRTGHGVHVTSRSEIPDVGAISPEFDGGDDPETPEVKPSTSGSATAAATPNPRDSTSGSGEGIRGTEVKDTQGLERERSRSGSGNEDSLGSEDFVSSNGGQYYSSHSFGGKPLYDKVNGLYICQFCNKSFDRLFSLHRHERVHTGYKPCYCTYCGRGFSEPRNLRHHMIRFHSDGSQIHLIKRMRKKPTVDSGLSRTSQRLPLVTPEMIARANQEAALRGSKVAAADRGEGRSEGERAPRSPIIVEPRYHHQGEPPAKKLASEIREKERLDEDVTVVIPSDVPYDVPHHDVTHDVTKDRNMQTPKSQMSDNTSWSGNLSEGEGEGSPGGGEIISAPVKSIMGGFSLSSRAKRKHSAPAPSTPLPSQGSPPRDREEETRDDTDAKDKQDAASALSSAHHHFLGAVSTATAAAAASDLKYHTSSTPMSLPFSPLSISTLVNPGLAGLMPSPMMSPLGQAALFGQHGLTSPGMVGNPLPFFPPIPSAMVATTATTTTASPAKDTASSSGGSSTAGGGADMDDYPGWMGKGGTRGSSLSRTHSRLYVVNKPVKREDVCKPTVLPDGRTVYRCSYCNKDFCTFSDVNRHMDFHEDIRPYKCKFCDYYARTNSQLKVHMMRHQGIREFHCKLCNYKGVTQSDLNRHMKSQIHMMKARNECKHCGEGFVSPMNLEKHYHEKHFSQFEQLANQAGSSK